METFVFIITRLATIACLAMLIYIIAVPQQDTSDTRDFW